MPYFGRFVKNSAANPQFKSHLAVILEQHLSIRLETSRAAG